METVCLLARKGEKTKVILEYGGFQEEEKAREEGIKLLRNVKLQMCKYNNPINISGINGMLDCKEHSVMPARFTEDGLSFIKQKLIESGMISADKIVMEDVLKKYIARRILLSFVPSGI